MKTKTWPPGINYTFQIAHIRRWKMSNSFISSNSRSNIHKYIVSLYYILLCISTWMIFHCLSPNIYDLAVIIIIIIASIISIGTCLYTFCYSAIISLISLLARTYMWVKLYMFPVVWKRPGLSYKKKTTYVRTLLAELYQVYYPRTWRISKAVFVTGNTAWGNTYMYVYPISRKTEKTNHHISEITNLLQWIDILYIILLD